MVSDVSRLSAAEVSLSADLIAQRGFATSRRGFDPDEVRAFLTQVAKEFRALRQREGSLEQALRDAEYRAAHPKWDENTLLSAVGDETASILRSAHAAAADIRAKSEENAARILKEAHDQADAMRAESETVLGARTEEADAAAAQIRERAAADAERMHDAAREQAEAIRQEADTERRAMVEAAQTTRERILADLARKRRVAAVQIEQLRAGRERLLESYRVVRRTLDEVTDELQRADAEARAAAEAVGRRQAVTAVESPPVESAPVDGPSVDAGQVGEVPSEPGRPAESMTGPATLSDSATAADSATGGAAVGVKERTEEPASVKDLFDRIRAGQAQAPGVSEEGRAGADAPDGSVAGATPAEGTVAAVGGEASNPSGPAAVEAPRPETPAEPVVPNPDEMALQRRDEAVGTIEANLARRLKRVLQDDQNELLDRLRNVRGKLSADAVLPSRDAHVSSFAETGRPALQEAVRAGATFSASLQDTDPPAAALPGADDLARDLAGDVVDPLRRRLEDVFAEEANGDTAALAESIGSAYREWKTQRIEQTAADHVAGAFAKGAFSMMPGDSRLRWIVDDVDGPCPDCDDNALAGGLPKGEMFPTGQAHPPAHPGCRCLLVPETG